MEIWKDVAGFEGLYMVSDKGTIKSLDKCVNATQGSTRIMKGRILKPYDTNRKEGHYKGIDLYKNKVKYKKNVHRIVAEAFIPNPNNLPCINHKDENRFNNSVDNLEWCDYKYNNSYGNRLKKIGKKHMKKVICINNGWVFESIKQAAEVMQLSRSDIGNICNGRLENRRGYSFRFL